MKYIDGKHSSGLFVYEVKKIDCEIEGKGCIGHACPLFVGRGSEYKNAIGFCRYYGADSIIKKEGDSKNVSV